MWSKVGYWLLMVLILCALNTATIVWLVYNYIPFADIGNGIEVSMWDASMFKSQLSPDQYLTVAEKGTIYLFMLIGGGSTIGFVRWLFIDTVQQIRKKKNKEMKKYLNED